MAEILPIRRKTLYNQYLHQKKFLMKPSVCLYCFTTVMIMMGWKYVHFQSNGFYAHFQENFIFFILYIYAQVCIFSPPLTWLKYCRYGVKLYPINQLYFLSNRSIHLNPRIYPVSLADNVRHRLQEFPSHRIRFCQLVELPLFPH